MQMARRYGNLAKFLEIRNVKNGGWYVSKKKMDRGGNVRPSNSWHLQIESRVLRIFWDSNPEIPKPGLLDYNPSMFSNLKSPNCEFRSSLWWICPPKNPNCSSIGVPKKFSCSVPFLGLFPTIFVHIMQESTQTWRSPKRHQKATVFRRDPGTIKAPTILELKPAFRCDYI